MTSAAATKQPMYVCPALTITKVKDELPNWYNNHKREKADKRISANSHCGRSFSRPLKG